MLDSPSESLSQVVQSSPWLVPAAAFLGGLPFVAGPALSLPKMLVFFKPIGVTKTVAFCAIIVVVATYVGMIYWATPAGQVGVVGQTGGMP